VPECFEAFDQASLFIISELLVSKMAARYFVSIRLDRNSGSQHSPWGWPPKETTGGDPSPERRRTLPPSPLPW